jgi:branched-subunit amino acid transport protein
MNETLLVLGMMLVTFGVRYPVLAFVGKIPLSGPVRRSLRFVPPAVLAALITPAMLIPSGDKLEVTLRNPYLVAGMVAITMAGWRKNLLLTIVTGMLSLWGMQWVLAR